MKNTNDTPTRVRSYLTKKGVSLSPKVYFVDAMSAMALGLFASLLMATIFGTVLKYVPSGNVFHELLTLLSKYAPATGGATGAVLGIAVAYALKAPALVMFASGVVGLCGAFPFPLEANLTPAYTSLTALCSTSEGASFK